MKQPALVTRDSLKEMLATAPLERQVHIIGRALVALLQYQTANEQRCNSTDEDNGVGFTGADARSGTLTAKSYLKHKSLQEWQAARWLKSGSNGYPRICKYHKQLNTIALAKQPNSAQAYAEASGR
jgi:hypothetical protein